MSSSPRNLVRDRIVAFFVVTALCWVVFVVPIFVIGIGMFGSTIADGLRTTAENAAAGDALSVAMVALTVCLLGLPWALGVLVGER